MTNKITHACLPSMATRIMGGEESWRVSTPPCAVAPGKGYRSHIFPVMACDLSHTDHPWGIPASDNTNFSWCSSSPYLWPFHRMERSHATGHRNLLTYCTWTRYPDIMFVSLTKKTIPLDVRRTLFLHTRSQWRTLLCRPAQEKKITVDVYFVGFLLLMVQRNILCTLTFFLTYK